MKNSNKMAKWKGLDKITVNLPIFSGKVHVSARMAGPSLAMKTAPLLHRNVSEYTSQCDQGNIVVVCVIRISLYNKDRRFILRRISKARISRCKPTDLVADFTRDH